MGRIRTLSMYEVIYSESVKKQLKKLDKQTARIIKNWIEKNFINTIDPRTKGKQPDHPRRTACRTCRNHQLRSRSKTFKQNSQSRCRLKNPHNSELKSRFILTFKYLSVESRVFLKHLRAVIPCLSLVWEWAGCGGKIMNR